MIFVDRRTPRGQTTRWFPTPFSVQGNLMTQSLSYGTEGNRAYSLYYRHSNRVGPAGLVLGGAAGLAVGLVAAVIYAYSIIYIPIVYARIACVLGFGAVLGYLPARIMRWGKVRSVPVVLTVVGIVAAAAYCFQWIVWIYAQLNRGPNGVSFDLLLTHPLAVLRNYRGGLSPRHLGYVLG